MSGLVVDFWGYSEDLRISKPWGLRNMKNHFYHNSCSLVSFPVLIFWGTSSGTHLGMIGTIKPQKSTSRTPIPLHSLPARHFGVLAALCEGMRVLPGGILEWKYLHLGEHWGKKGIYHFCSTALGQSNHQVGGPNSPCSLRYSPDKNQNKLGWRGGVWILMLH